MNASKKPAKSARGKIRDLSAKKNPKGGLAIVANAPQLGLGALATGSSATGGAGSGKSPTISEIVITKKTDSSSPNLY